MPRQLKYDINGVSLQEYFKSIKHQIVAMEKWQDKTEEIVDAAQEIAPAIPKKILRQTYNKIKKKWMTVDDEQFNKLFEQE